MITLDEALADCQNATSDTTSQSQSLFITGLNQGYQNLIAMFGRPGIEKTVNTTTNLPSSPLQDSDRSYQLPPDYLFMKTLKIKIGSRWYNLIEEESTEMWNYRIEYAYGGIPSLFYVNPNFGVASAEVQIDPIATATTVSGSLLIPTVATMSGTTLTLTFSSIPSTWVAGTTVTLAGFTLANGININENWVIATSNGSTQLTITIPGGLTTTVSTIGTVGTTVGVPMQIVYESSDVKLDHLQISPLATVPTASTLTFSNNSNIVNSSAAIFSNWMAAAAPISAPATMATATGTKSWHSIIRASCKLEMSTKVRV
jgi:hypothetical protein